MNKRKYYKYLIPQCLDPQIPVEDNQGARAGVKFNLVQ